jgi:NitT/TauT family transport system ATP-binding protein
VIPNARSPVDSAEAEPRQASNTKVRIRGLRKQFFVRTGAIDVLESIDLDIEQGEFLVIVGASGCGKTTLLRIIAGLEERTDGLLEFSRESDPSTRRPMNSMVFQEHGVFPWLTVRDNVAFGLKAQGVRRSERRETADRFIDMVGLSKFRTAYPHQLSGGMKQRVSIARAFASNPEMLLMDEPFASLDEQTKLTLQGELMEIWESDRKTVVYVTHSIDEALIMADRILVMAAHPGRVADVIDLRSEFPHPRKIENIKASAAYGETFNRIWRSLRGGQVES